MIKKLFLPVASIALLILFFFGCSSEEYTTAKLAIQQKEWERAEEFLIKAMVVEPDNPEIPYQLGEQIYSRNKDWVKMNEAFEKALAIDPERSIIIGPTVREYVTNSREKYWVAAYNDAVNYFKQANNAADEMTRKELLELTLEKFTTAAAISPKEAQTYASMASLYIDMNDMSMALSSISKAAELATDNAKIMLVAGQIYSRGGDCEQAMEYFRKAVDLDPNNTNAIRSLASNYYDCGDRDNAIVTYEVAIGKETDPKIKADLHFNLGVLYNQAEDFDQAEENFMIALDLNPEDVEAIVGMALVFEKAEKWRQAERFYKQLIEIDPDNSNHYKGMARVLLRQGNQDEAQYYFEKSKTVGY
ncbi:MAG: tetratricopeptide repeat protein [Candidatus Neomarinimicrobiota bacterium]